MYGFVYIWRDKKHNRYYIGSHWGHEDDGYICSSPWMRQAYKHRPEDFRRKILSRVSTNRTDLLKEEQRWFDMIKSEEIKIRYYNLKLKAHGVWHSSPEKKQSVGQKISQAKKGKNTGKRPESVGKAISESKLRKCAERRESIGSSFTEDHRKAMSECKLGTKQTEESNRKRSDTIKRKYESGEIPTSRSPLTKEHKSKISEALKSKDITPQARDNMSKAQSKQYTIRFMDGRETIVHGLKTFCINNHIPYVTARKAFETKTPIKKYQIECIEELS